MERQATIGPGENKLTVTLSEAQSVDIINARGEVVGNVRGAQITAPQIFYLEEGAYNIVSDGTIDEVTVEAEAIPTEEELADLEVAADAPDRHIVDGIGEIPADGQSFTTITVQKINMLGEPLKRRQDNNELFLRTNAGMIKNNQGQQDIRSMKLRNGRASFRLYSETIKRVATVQIISADDFLADTAISIEFY